MSIQKQIFYCWFGGDKPQKVMDCINNWKQMLTNYKIIEINEFNKDLFDIENECENNLWFKTCYENKMWAYVSDYARLKVLYEQGGIYLDTDITVEKDISELLEKSKLILGWEDKKNINFAVCVVPQKNELIKEIIDFYSKKIWKYKLFTIPQIATFVLKKQYKLNSSTEVTENDDILILPQEYFYPIPFGLKEKDGFVTEKTYTVHWWDASWVKSNIDYFMRNKHKIKLDKLIEKCFKQKLIINTPFIKIEKLFNKYAIEIDFYWLFKFKYRYYKKKKYLTIFIFGYQIKLWEINN